MGGGRRRLIVIGRVTEDLTLKQRPEGRSKSCGTLGKVCPKDRDPTRR